MKSLITKGAIAVLATSAAAIWAGCTERRTTESVASTPLAQPSVWAPIGLRIPFEQKDADFNVRAHRFTAHIENGGNVQIASNDSVVPLQIHTTQVGALSSSGLLSKGSEVGMLTRTMGEVREEWLATGESIEARWAFASKPNVVGDLVVRLDAHPRGRVDVASDGLHFADEHLNVGRGTWIDSRGLKVDVPIAFEAGEIRFTVPAEAIAKSVFPAVLDPKISPEFEPSPSVDAGFAAQNSPLNSRVNRATAAAFDGTNYLVAWYDDRAFTPIVMAARVSPSGELIDRAGIQIGTVSPQPRFDQDDPMRSIAVVAGNGGFLVVWRDTYLSAGQATSGGVRIRSNGEVVDKTPLSLGTILDDRPIALPIASFGDSFLMLSANVISGTDIRIDLVKVEGVESTKTPAVQTTPSTAVGGLNRIRLSSVGAEGLVVYENYPPGQSSQKTMAMRVAPSGQVGEPFELGFTANQVNLLMRVGNNLALAWYGEAEAGSNDYVTLLTTSGQVVGSPTAIAASTFMGDAQGLVSLGGNSLCFFTTNLTPLGCTFAVDPNERALLALDPNNALVLTPYDPQSTPSDSQGPKAVRYDRATRLKVGSDIRVGTAGNSQARPAVAYDSKVGAYFGTWIDDHLSSTPPNLGGGSVIRGVAIRDQGATIGAGADIPISVSGATAVTAPSAIFDGENVVVVWAERRDSTYYVTMSKIVLSQTGGVLTAVASTPVIVRTTSLETRSAVIAADSTGYVISWSEGARTAGHISAIRVSKTVIQSDIAGLSVLFLTADEPSRPRDQVTTVFDGQQTLVVWREKGGAATILVGLTFQDGAARPASAPFSVATGFSEKETMHLASDGKTGSLLVWADTATLVRGIRAKFLSRESLSAGEPAVKPTDPRNGIQIAQTKWSQANPTVAFANDQASYFVAWSSLQNTNDSALVGSFIALDGRVLEGASPLVLSDTTAAVVAAGNNSPAPGENEDWAALTSGPEATLGLLYNRFDTRPGYATVRARFRTVISGKMKAAECISNDECASRYCVSGVCCESACNEGCATCGGTGSAGATTGAAKGTCSPLASKTVCTSDARFVCDGTSQACPKSCATDAQCAGGACRDGQCTRGGAVCADDFNIATPTGNVSCGAYRCTEGTCLTECTSVDQCAPSNICNFEKRCAPAPAIENPPDGCSVGAVGMRAGGGFAGLVLGAGMVVRRRRGRRAQS